jgi:hypothetical protein
MELLNKNTKNDNFRVLFCYPHGVIHARKVKTGHVALFLSSKVAWSKIVEKKYLK